MRSGIPWKKTVQLVGCALFCLLILVLAFRNRTLALEPIEAFFRGEAGFEEARDTLADNYLSGRMTEKDNLVTLSGGFSRLLGRTRCNHVQRMNNGMLTTLKSKIPDLTAFEENVDAFHRFLSQRGIPFLFIAAPHKVPTDENLLPAGVADLQNAAQDRVMAGLAARGVPSVDLRPEMSRTAAQVEKYFYRTDHHWNAEGALYAFRRIMELIQDRLPGVKANYTDPALWEKTVLPRWWLGSAGRRVGPLFGGTDDLDFYLPVFDTSMARYSPGYWAYKGDFRRVNLREWFIDHSDLMNLDSYNRYVGGHYPLTLHRNAQAENPLRILCIRDSFMLPVECFLSTEFAAVDVLNPQDYHAMSVVDYVLLNPPDLVLMLNFETTMEQEGYRSFGPARGTAVRGETLFQEDSCVISGSDGADYLSVPLSLRPGQSCEMTVESIRAGARVPEGVSLLLYRGTQLLDETAFDLDYGNLYGFRWGFQIPEDPENPDRAGDYELRLAAGIAGDTAGITLTCGKIRVDEIILPET